MSRIAGSLLAFAIALVNAPANAQAGTTPATADNEEKAQPSTASELPGVSGQPHTADDVCRALEQAAAENALPVEFFARVIWQESHFNAKAVSPKGAQGIAQLCRGPPAGTALSIPSIQSRRCGTRRLTYENCWTDLAILGLLRQRTMQGRGE
jgi:hypothetical protein